MCKKRVCEPVSLIRVDFNPFNSLLGEGGGGHPRGSLDCPENWGIFFNHEN